MVANFRDTLFVPSCVVTIYQGWRVVATSFEVGGRLHACSEGGMVAALDFPLCHDSSALCRFDRDGRRQTGVQVSIVWGQAGCSLLTSCGAFHVARGVTDVRTHAHTHQECSLVPWSSCSHRGARPDSSALATGRCPCPLDCDDRGRSSGRNWPEDQCGGGGITPIQCSFDVRGSALQGSQSDRARGGVGSAMSWSTDGARDAGACSSGNWQPACSGWAFKSSVGGGSTWDSCSAEPGQAPGAQEVGWNLNLRRSLGVRAAENLSEAAVTSDLPWSSSRCPWQPGSSLRS